MTYEISAYEYKWVNGAPTEEVEVWVVWVDGKEGPIFATKGEAQGWVSAQNV